MVRRMCSSDERTKRGAVRTWISARAAGIETRRSSVTPAPEGHRPGIAEFPAQPEGGMTLDETRIGVPCGQAQVAATMPKRSYHRSFSLVRPHPP